MASSFSPNKNFELQATGENQGTWGTKLNANYSLLDSILGAGLAVTVAGTNITLTAAQAANLYYRLTGSQSANIDLTFPSPGGGFFIIDNSTTSATAYTVTVKAAGGGRSFIAPRGQKTIVFSDSTNIDPMQTLPTIWCGATGGTTTAYTVTAPGNITALITGLCVHVQWNATNTAACTLNLSTLGAKSVYKPGTSGPVTVLAGELPIGGSSILIYDASLNAGAGAWVALTGIPQVPLVRTIATGTGLSGGGDLSADRTLILANTTVAAASYGSASNVATFTVDAQGRLTAAANAAINVVSLLGFTPVNKAGDTMTGALIVQSTGLTPGGFTSTEAGATKAPVDLYRNSASPAASDSLISLAFTGQNSLPAKKTYAEIVALIKAATNGSEEGLLALRTILLGTEADRFLLGAGLYAASLVDQGAGTLNGAGFFRNNTELPNQRKFTSTYQSLPAAGGLLTIAHGLGVAPDPSEVRATVQNVSGATVAGWSDGDVFSVQLQQFDGGSTNITGGCIVYTDATNIYLRRNATGSIFLLLNKSSGVNTVVTEANWNISLNVKV